MRPGLQGSSVQNRSAGRFETRRSGGPPCALGHQAGRACCSDATRRPTPTRPRAGRLLEAAVGKQRSAALHGVIELPLDDLPFFHPPALDLADQMIESVAAHGEKTAAVPQELDGRQASRCRERLPRRQDQQVESRRVEQRGVRQLAGREQARFQSRLFQHRGNRLR